MACEQAPFPFTKFDAQTERATLLVGDYSQPGFEDRVAIERKELNDLTGCLMNGNRTRFEKELQNGRYNDSFVIIVEATPEDASKAGIEAT